MPKFQITTRETRHVTYEISCDEKNIHKLVQDQMLNAYMVEAETVGVGLLHYTKIGEDDKSDIIPLTKEEIDEIEKTEGCFTNH
jgi:hypothetical protein